MSDVTFQAERRSTMFLCVEWMSGGDADDNIEFDLVCGAGVGSALMRLTVKVDGQRIEEVIDIREGLTAWINQIVEGARGAA